MEVTVNTGNKHAGLTVFPFVSCQLTPLKPGGQEPVGAASKVRVGSGPLQQPKASGLCDG